MDVTRVGDCVSDALADFERQGVLGLADVQRLLDLHHLAGDELAAVFVELRSHGVPIDEARSEDSEFTTRRVARSDSARDTLGMMLAAASRTKLLRADEEVLLGRRIHLAEEVRQVHRDPPAGSDEALQLADGKRAHDELVLANLRLVVSIAKRYRPSGMEMADVIQDGTIGLMRAADKFDHTLGYKFSTYATWWIRQAITRGIADKGRLIRLPVHVHEELQRVHGARVRLREATGHEPTLEEIAASLDVDPAGVRAIVDIAREPLSLDAPIADDTSTDLAEILDLYADDVADGVVNFLLNVQFHEVLAKVEVRQRSTTKGAGAEAVAMLRLRYGLEGNDEHTLEEIGEIYGVTRERVRQIINRIMESLRLAQSLVPFASVD